MLKIPKSVKSLKARALEALKAALSQIPSIKVKGVDSEAATVGAAGFSTPC
jgi:hypothetical protein